MMVASLSSAISPKSERTPSKSTSSKNRTVSIGAMGLSLLISDLPSVLLIDLRTPRRNRRIGFSKSSVKAPSPSDASPKSSVAFLCSSQSHPSWNRSPLNESTKTSGSGSACASFTTTSSSDLTCTSPASASSLSAGARLTATNGSSARSSSIAGIPSAVRISLIE